MRVGRFAAGMALVLLGGAIVLLAPRAKALPHRWFEIGALVLIAVTIYVGLWARKMARLSLSLVLLLGGNVLCSGAILLPLGIELRSWILDGAFSLYVLSFLARLAQLGRVMAKR
jgi:hypothetical protein